ncbi:MAG: T9SS type A sorting domain-containing protein [Flavobacteriia bacterium]|nr:T9SS type A sorting domain-containing protein [Flavobacteriia bacterium]
MKLRLLVVFTALSLSTFGQQLFQFRDYIHPEVTRNGNILMNGFAAGMNNPQFSPIDLNQDGSMDLLVFDRDGNSLLPFLTVGSAPNTHYEFAPEYVDSFPDDLRFIVKLVDYNCDGKMDIFYKVTNGIGVYKNTSTGNGLSFEWALGSDTYLTTQFANGQTSQVYVLELDMPVIDDVDGDGDIDILSFETNGVQVYFYQNVSSDGCGLDFYLRQDCWGGFREDPNNNGVEIDACIPGNAPPFDPETGAHAGSTILSFDSNNDGIEELVMGDISFPESSFLMNSGVPDSAYVGSQVSNWAPDGNVPVNLYVFPAFYYMDVTFDGVPDLIAAPNIMPSKNLRQVWMYENNGTANNPTFSFSDSSFLQSTMIDMGEGAYPAFVDLNGDNLDDIVLGNRGVWQSGGNYTASLWYLKNTSANGNYSFEVVTENLAPLSSSVPLSPIPTFADLDGDNDFDMIVGFEDGQLSYYENTGNIGTPTFTLVTNNFGGIDVGANASPELYDFDGDGDYDLLIGEKSGNVNYYENNNGTYTLVTDKFGGINTDFYGQFSGYAMPRMYEYNGKDQLMVGSEHTGIQQFDSASAIINQPSTTEAQFGNGTASTTTTEETPFGAVKRTGRNQFLFRASELKAMGFTYGQVEKIAFNVTTSNTSNSLTNGATVRFGNTDSTELNSFHTGLTVAYDNVMPITPGWNEINMQDPFIWDGESNLIIEICFSRNLPLVDNQVEVTDVGFSANAYGDITGWNSNTKNGCNMPYLATSTLRPNTKITIRPITPPAGQILKGFRRMHADFSDLDGDSFPEVIIGSFGGGLILMKGEAKDHISVDEVNPHLEATIYPNPTEGRFFVQLDDMEPAEYKVFDLNGRLQGEGRFEGQTEINLGHLANGIYILHVVQDQRSSYAKIIKR